MLARLSFVLIALFWVTMNVFLWRSEYGSGEATGSPVPAQVVWQKILTAPDNSNLTIRQRGKTIGFCRWSTAISEEFADMEEAPSGGAIEKLRKYRIRLDGNINVPESKETLRFESSLKLANQTDWDEFALRVRFQSLVAHVQSRAAEQSVRLAITNGVDTLERVISFSDLQNPQVLLQTLVAPLAPGLINNLDLPALPQGARAKADAIQWQARFDTLYVSHQPLLVYRLEGRVADRFQVIMYISRVGEIFKVELPGGIVLLHDRLLTY